VILNHVSYSIRSIIWEDYGRLAVRVPCGSVGNSDVGSDVKCVITYGVSCRSPTCLQGVCAVLVLTGTRRYVPTKLSTAKIADPHVEFFYLKGKTKRARTDKHVVRKNAMSVYTKKITFIC
jgi:hypothetical protein